MKHVQRDTPHTFYIPVMGTGFSIDSPVKVARFGITSVVSIVDDVLIENMRRHYCLIHQEEYAPIRNADKDSRAQRITSYLDLLQAIVGKQITRMKQSTFEPGNELSTYFDILPECPLKDSYKLMASYPPGKKRDQLEKKLKERIIPGKIDVNIMTKLDRRSWSNGRQVSAEYSDAVAALRGYAQSSLESSVIFSAGMNPGLFSTLEQYPDFHADINGKFRKKITLKVSDYRSAMIQGTLLAKKGLWVSEYRVESGLNCGGHAFVSKANLLGPILEEFQLNRKELTSRLYSIYLEACKKAGRPYGSGDISLKVQGGIGTAEESEFLRKHYNIDSTGWGTPFMLVPEATNLDSEHLEMLSGAKKKDVFLSYASPLGIFFWNLKNSAAEKARKKRIAEGHPGALCTKGFLAMDTEFTDKPVCAASRAFQKLKIEALKLKDVPEKTKKRLMEIILAKTCLCSDLGASVTKKIGLNPDGTTAVTPGPNIINFSRIVSLKEMVGHIYGRINLITGKNRPHFFIRELELYVTYLKEELYSRSLGIIPRERKYFTEFYRNLLSAVGYYKNISDRIEAAQRKKFLRALENLRQKISFLQPEIESLTE